MNQSSPSPLGQEGGLFGPRKGDKGANSPMTGIRKIGNPKMACFSGEKVIGGQLSLGRRIPRGGKGGCGGEHVVGAVGVVDTVGMVIRQKCGGIAGQVRAQPDGLSFTPTLRVQAQFR